MDFKLVMIHGAIFQSWLDVVWIKLPQIKLIRIFEWTLKEFIDSRWSIRIFAHDDGADDKLRIVLSPTGRPEHEFFSTTPEKIEVHDERSYCRSGGCSRYLELNLGGICWSAHHLVS